MTTSWPGAFDTFPTHSAGQTILSADVNKLQAAVAALEQTCDVLAAVGSAPANGAQFTGETRVVLTDTYAFTVMNAGGSHVFNVDTSGLTVKLLSNTALYLYSDNYATPRIILGAVSGTGTYGLTTNGTLDAGHYNLTSDGSSNLLINRPTGAVIDFREGNAPSGVLIAPAAGVVNGLQITLNGQPCFLVRSAAAVENFSVDTVTKLLRMPNGTTIGMWADSSFSPALGHLQMGFIASLGGTFHGISFNGALTTANYNLAGDVAGQDLYINRPTGHVIHIREANSTANAQEVVFPAGGGIGLTGAGAGGRLRAGTGAPNGVVVGSVGDLWLRTDGGAATTLYVKETGAATNSGWTAK